MSIKNSHSMNKKTNRMSRHECRLKLDHLYIELQGQKVNAFLTGIHDSYYNNRHHFISIAKRHGVVKKITTLVEEMKIEKLIIKCRNFIKKQLNKEFLNNQDNSAQCIRKLIYEASISAKKVVHQQVEQMKKQDLIFRPDAILVNNKFNQLELADKYITSSFNEAALTSKMLAYRHNWITKDGAIVFPDALLEDGFISEMQARNIGVLARMWDCIDHINQLLATNRCKLLRKIINDMSVKKTIYNLISSPDGEELYRLQSIDAERMNDLDNSSMMYLMETIRPSSISEAKKRALLSLLYFDHILFVNIEKEYKKLFNLSIKDLIFGYAALQAVVQASKRMTFLIKLKPGLVERYFSDFEINSQKFDKIIRIFTYGRSSKDFFDSPIISIADEKYLIGACANSANIETIILSIISTQKINLDHKGKLLEKKVIEFFNKNNIPAFTFETKSDGSQYEFDTICFWGNVVWIFECKNRGVIDLEPISAYFSEKQESEAIGQVIRQKIYLDHNRDRLVAEFGERARTAIIIPCILNALPHSRGLKKGVFIYDFVALQRLFSGPTIDYELRSGKPGARQLETTTAVKLWANDKIEWTDLLIQMKFPIQNFVAARQYNSLMSIIPLSNYLILAHNLFVRKGSNHEYTKVVISDYSRRLSKIRAEMR